MIEFEIIETYEIRKKDDEPASGWSIHAYFIDWELDIRGIQLIKKASGWHLRMPFLGNYDVEEKKYIRYPVISFLEREKNSELVEAIKAKAIEYVQKKIADEMMEKEKAFKEKKTKTINKQQLTK